ncbi:DNA polymerase [Ignicoccus islandicus DSM 13165]|uniref:DNA polymerase sliding clamp n=1 Tax=Ignicoccus islandicus DSM 13165 TaxID=940295 RepID=A0A0U3F8G8_9CREN|nr:DNA polymerase sliding clamp [Ignicoccus islandicus]ALU11929.1 DNA polymerase [Ignicoccus islandicus DSM 13165]
MRIVYPETKVFQSMVEALGKIVNEVALIADEEGIVMKALDPAQVALIQVKINKDVFLEYEVEGRESIGFNIANVLKFMKRAKKGYQLELGTEEGGSKFRIMLRGTLIKKYTILNLDVPEPEVPDLSSLNYSVKGSILASVLGNAIKDIEAISDTVYFEAPDTDTLLIKSGEGEAASVTKLTRASTALIELEVNEPAKGAYDVSFLKNVVSLTKVSDTIDFMFGNDTPLYLKFSIIAGGEVEYLLAPQAI